MSLKEDQFFSTWNTESLLMIDISDCLFNYVSSYTVGAQGGAVSVVAPRMLLRLRNSRFLHCGSYGNGGALFSGSQLTESVVLYVEQSHFVECKSNRARGGAVFIKSVTLANVTIINRDIVSNSASGFGGALNFVIAKSAINLENKDFQGDTENSITIESSRFVSCTAMVRGGAIFIEDLTAQHKITLKNITFANNSAEGPGGAVASMRLGSGDSRAGYENVIIIESCLFLNNAAGGAGGAIYIDSSTAESNFTIKQTCFKNNSAGGQGGAIYAVMPWDTLEDPGCIPKDRPTATREEEKKFPKWDYNSKLFFKEARFKYNTALIGGALYLNRGKTTFLNCSFQDNFASAVGGAIYAEERSTSVSVQECYFLQSKSELIRDLQTFSKSSFIHTESEGPFEIKNSTLNATRNAVGNSLVKIAKGGLVDFGDDNCTHLYCPKGSQMQLVNFSNHITTGTKDASCTIMVTGLDYSCLPCAGGLYSLQRGQVHGTHLMPGFKCLICPFGANCSDNIFAKQNFWGFEESHLPPALKFTICPPGYCGGNEQANSGGYNSCQGNRSGVLCGRCKLGYTETLYSTLCRKIAKCSDHL